MLSLISEISSIHLLYIIMYRDYPTWLPGFTLPRREVTVRLPSKLTALRIIPWLSMPIILRGAHCELKDVIAIKKQLNTLNKLIDEL